MVGRHNALQSAGVGRETQVAFPARTEAKPRPSLSKPVIIGVVRLLDVLIVLAAGALVPLILRAGAAPDAALGLRRQYAVAAIAGSITALLILARCDAYRLHALQHPSGQWKKLAAAVAFGAASLLAVLVELELPTERALAFASAWACTMFLSLAVARLATAHVIGGWSHAGRLAKRIAVIGATPASERLIQEIHDTEDPSARVEIIGVFDDRPARAPSIVAGAPVAGNVDDLLARSRSETVDSIIIALPVTAKQQIRQILAKLESSVADIHFAFDLSGLHQGRCSVEPLTDELIVGVFRRPLKDWDAFEKRTFDLIAGGALLLACAPVMLAIALLIKLDSPGPVLFRQKRYGFNNNTIDVLKFRTMYHHQSDPLGDRLTARDDARITWFGKWLRRTSLDELPQLFNVLRGDMSLVGPRPHALHAKAADRLYEDVVKGYARRHRVKPGITGWAQVNGWRGETRFTSQIEMRVAHDLYYIEHWSMWLDLKILALTFWREVLRPHAF